MKLKCENRFICANLLFVLRVLVNRNACVCLRFCYVVGQRQSFCVAAKMAATIDKSYGKT